MKELERKFALGPGVGAEEVAAALAPFGRCGATSENVLLATYFDTRRRRLASAGISLRRRQGGADAGWHLKLPSGPDERTEYWLPLSAGSGDQVPSDLAEMVGSHTKGRRLRPVALVRTRRTSFEVTTAGGGPLVQVADDRVVATRHVDGALGAWRELELEALGAGGGCMDELEACLGALGASRAAHPSKLAQVLAAPAPPRAQEEPVLARLAAQVATMLVCEARARAGEAEAIHDLRVAVRRLRSCLRSFGAAFEEATIAHLLEELKAIGELLGAARDAGVLADRLEAGLRAVPSSDVLGPVRAVLRAHGARATAAALRALQEAFAGPAYLDLLEQLVGVVDGQPSARGQGARRGYRRQLAHDEGRVARRLAAIAGLQGAARDAALHEARKAAKRARYSAETLAPVLGKAAWRAAGRYQELQDLLGEHHDAVVARAFLREEGARAGVRPGENGFTFGLLHAREDARAAAAERAAAKRWPKLAR